MEGDFGFDIAFRQLTGNDPFPWQRALFDRFVAGNFPTACDIPTGLGKTAVIAIWLLALARRAEAGTVAGFPRRLVYVVNRRTVVDQSTNEAERLRAAFCASPGLRRVAEALKSLGAVPTDVPLAISTLRGEFADNAQWRNDPARPAVVIGTVDMIGSRLLFSGYGCGFKSRPLHAGLLGQETLLVHDEAHLEPAFQKLLSSIEAEQLRCGDIRPLRVVALTATARGEGQSLVLSEADSLNPVVCQRIHARKGIAFHRVDEAKRIGEKVGDLALDYKDTGLAILVYLRTLESVRTVTEKLAKAKQSFQVLTGTLRGLERDELATRDDVFVRFLQRPDPAPRRGTAYLVCTSAGEVGVNLSADHLVCDLTPFDSMAQRFGRVNRFGGGDALIDIVHGPTESEGENSDSMFDVACRCTLSLLQRLPVRADDQRHDAAPAALAGLHLADRQAAFTPPPGVLPASDILFDAWAMTSIRLKMPGRPSVADWLHGEADWEPPETRVAWREEVAVITGELAGRYPPADLLGDYPLKQHEVSRDRTDRVLKCLKKMAKEHGRSPVWVSVDEDVTSTTLEELVGRTEAELWNATIVLPPEAGGIRNGMLDGSAYTESGRYDVADEVLGEGAVPQRRRLWDDEAPPDGMRLVRTIDTLPDHDEDSEDVESGAGHRFWRWYVRPSCAEDDGSETTCRPQELASHLMAAQSIARRLVALLGVPEPEAAAVVLSAGWHDLGKNRAVWQRAIGNRQYPELVLAKSGGRMRTLELSSYRHEFGTLMELTGQPEFAGLQPDVQDLVLHLVGAHHGRARPQFPENESFDPNARDALAEDVAGETPRRFARLQRKYGRWGLAWIESLVRAADALASQEVQQ